jgi:omega-6 fatty acid desaturase (delta-12 desaturase)
LRIRQNAISRADEARRWAPTLNLYRQTSRIRSIAELLVTLLPLALLWGLMCVVLQFSYGLALVMAVPAAGFLVRLFMIQHDCGHGAFFAHRRTNDWIGRVLGVLTLTPYDFWRRTHAQHHATSGNLDRRGMGDIDTLTVREYLARSGWGRFGYRLYRHPAVMFGLGPSWLFLMQHRLPVGLMRGAGWGPWLSTMGSNAAIALATVALVWCVGLETFLLVHLPIVVLAASIGVFLFYIQHQFAGTTWHRTPHWNHQEAALHGSSHYHLPGVLRWFTANIGVHHVHHLCSRIPYYRLSRVLRDHPELAGISRLSLMDSFRSVRLALWCEDRQRLISFRDLRLATVAAR